MIIKFIEVKKTTVNETVETTVDGKTVREHRPKEVEEEIEIPFETHPHEVVVSMLARYTKATNKRLPKGARSWVALSHATGKPLKLLSTVKENGTAIDKGIVLDVDAVAYDA